jgi:hypothetical protein
MRVAAFDNLSARVMDLMVPIGKGQRGLIVAPPCSPRAGGDRSRRGSVQGHAARRGGQGGYAIPFSVRQGGSTPALVIELVDKKRAGSEDPAYVAPRLKPRPTERRG